MRPLALSIPTVIALLAAAAAQVAQAGQARPAQGVDYDIEARLDESRQVLDGRLRLTYTNHAPDTLDRIYLHLHLNAFRPNSRWARAERRPWLDFQSLEDPDYAFERLGSVEIDGRAVVPRYPYAPDSTVVELPLERPLGPGGTRVVTADWQARPATLPRRQGRRGRHWDFAQWYPRIAVYDRFGWQAHPLYPQGEFYGEFGSYDVTVEVAEDQVIGATGVPVEGDPGWRSAAASDRVTHQREYYRDREARSDGDRGAGSVDDAGATGRRAGRLGLLGSEPRPGYKRVRWRAEDVHHFAWSVDPAFMYEEGRYEDIVIRALYRPEEAEGWSGIAVENARKALAWFDSVFGPYVWPQLTVLRRIEGGGTEFPMLVMQGNAGEGLTVHEVAHEYAHGMLANNEWKEGWLDEGFASFLTREYMESRYGPYGPGAAPTGIRARAPRLTMRESGEIGVLRMDLDGRSQPISTVSEHFSEFAVYGAMIYTKGSLVLDMLRYVIGDDRFRDLFRTYFERHRLSHVDEDAFRDTAEDVCGCDLNWFFGQWLHATPLIDYELGDVRTRRADGGFVTRVEVVRNEDGVMPVEVAVTDAEGREHRARVPGQARSEHVEIRTSSEPRDVAIDPDHRILDWNPSNNRRAPVWRHRPAHDMLDWPFLRPVRRNGFVREWMPLAWYNDADHAVLGLRARENLMGWLAVNEFGLAIGVEEPDEPHVWARWRNPVWWRAPGQTRELSLWRVEGRAGASLRIEKDISPYLQLAPERHWSIGLHVMDADGDDGRLPPGRWTPATTAELRVGYGESRDLGQGRVRLNAGTAVGGYAYDGQPPGREASGGYVRGTADVTWGVGDATGPFLGSRLFAGGVEGTEDDVPEQRRIHVAGAGPYEVFWNPFLRSRGSLFRRGDVRYFAPGGGGLRAYGPELGGRWAATGLARAGLRTRVPGNATVELSGFAEGGWVDGPRVLGPGGSGALWLFDAGPGVRLRRPVLDSSIEVRVDFPVYANRPGLATDARDDEWGFRWAVTLGAGF